AALPPSPRVRVSWRLALLLAVAVGGVAGAQDIGIRQYKPKSTLIVDEHPVPRARYPVIDIHSHHRDLSPARLARVVEEMDALNLQVLVNLSGGTGEARVRGLQAIENGPARGRMMAFATLDFSDLDQPGYGTRAAARLEADVRAGAQGLKIFKDLGLTLRRRGERVPVDDPEFDPIWE